MPRTGLQTSPELSIKLDGPVASHYPGETLTGEIIRRIHTVSTRAWITIRLYGRTKSKLTIRRNNGSSTTTHHYRGRFNLFAPDEICQKVHDGPVHIPPGGGPQTWRFALIVPTAPSPRSVKMGNIQGRSFLPLNDADIAASSLPSTFAFETARWRERFHCFVEYYLEAEFRQENSSHITKAIVPIPIQTASIPYPFEKFDLNTRKYSACFKTQRLIPGMENTELSFGQTMQKLFGSSKVPQFGFSVQVDYPTIIQMQNPNPISFKIRIIPDRIRTSNVILDVPQTIRLTSLSMEIQATTSIICDATFSSRTASATEKYNFAGQGTILGGSPITISPDPDAKALDLGALLELSLHPQHANARGRALHRFGQLYPSFVTYNIKHSHRLRWQLILEAAGESEKFTGEQAVSILAAS
ncbi:hypothetical protein OIDMADRAFT_117635 [Oidiodendron maius Zn]|uniref:Arrestin-like N-terminal domain-containing protein n=1 Tax=Oidiodendron maius (strain Zn) TaxID=913774 RepID=A0A0C3HMH1_OIDMZ|nr:hypothetical protein OIDMADRAFT_117635 [Oidiodendron maius Zn]